MAERNAKELDPERDDPPGVWDISSDSGADDCGDAASGDADCGEAGSGAAASGAATTEDMYVIARAGPDAPGCWPAGSCGNPGFRAGRRYSFA